MSALAVVPNATLAERAAEVRLIIETLEALDRTDALTPQAHRLLQERLETSIAGTRTKVDDTAAALRHFQVMMQAADLEIERLTERKERYRKQSERLQLNTLATIAQQGPLEGFTSTLRAVRNPVRVVIDCESLIPRELFRVPPRPPQPEPQPNKAAIRAQIERGVEVPGARLVPSERLEVL